MGLESLLVLVVGVGALGTRDARGRADIVSNQLNIQSTTDIQSTRNVKMKIAFKNQRPLGIHD